MKNVKLWVVAFVGVIVIVTGCTGILGSFDVADAPADGGGPADLGKTCASGTECSTGFCTDGVCCNTECKGTCESCGQAATKGTCSPIPEGMDPDVECKGDVRPDAGPASEPDASDLDAGDFDASDPDATAPPDVDAGPVVNLPDGGVVADDTACAGSCDGARACKFPGKNKNCGTKFCNSSTEQAANVCNGKGLCNLALDKCSAYACTGNECRTTCAANSDCLDSHFCNAQGMCQEKLANGLQCAIGTQCRNGFCVTDTGSSVGVCCNSDCGKIPGGKCAVAGSEGKCKCVASDRNDCGSGACRIEYPDTDNDGHGDQTATIANTKAKVGCDNRVVNPGYVVSNDDCSDQDNRAYPGQTAYFTTPVVGGAVSAPYDFNCNGTTEKGYKEFPGQSCHYCGEPKTCADLTSCTTKGQGSRLSCDYYYDPLGCVVVGGTCYYCGGGGRGNVYNKGFTQTVACGASATYSSCNSCTTANTPATATTSTVVQSCH